jgi:hypothetical protein
MINCAHINDYICKNIDVYMYISKYMYVIFIYMYNMYTDDRQGPSNQNEKAWLEIRDNTVALVAYYTTEL